MIPKVTGTPVVVKDKSIVRSKPLLKIAMACAALFSANKVSPDNCTNSAGYLLADIISQKFHNHFLYSKFSFFFLDFCSKVNCLHGGSCRNTAVKAVCDCRRGYTGRICETGICPFITSLYGIITLHLLKKYSI